MITLRMNFEKKSFAFNSFKKHFKLIDKRIKEMNYLLNCLAIIDISGMFARIYRRKNDKNK
jgi:hypothetical protein